MKTVKLRPLTEMARRILSHFGDEWVINNDTGHSLVVTNLDESMIRVVRKRHDDHFEICTEAA